MPIDRPKPSYRLSEPQDDWGFIQDVVAPAPAPTPAPVPFNPVGFDWATQGTQNIGGTIYQPQFEQYQDGSEFGGWANGPLQSIMRYKEGATGPGQTYEYLDPATGKVIGTGKFKEQSHGFFGDLWDMVSSAASDLAPVLQFTPVGPAIAAINAVNAARTGDVLPAIASVAGLGGYSDFSNAARAATAIKNEDYLGAVLPALSVAGISNVGGYNLNDINQAANVARAIESKNPLSLVGALAKYVPDIAGQQGFMLPETADPTQFWYPEAAPVVPVSFPEFDQPLLTAEPPASTPITAPERMAFLEANIAEPETVQQLMQQYYPEIYAPAPVDNEMAKFMRQQELAQAGESPLGGMGPGAKELPLINLSGTPAPKPAPAPSPASAPAVPKGNNLGGLAAMLAGMAAAQQQQKQDPYQVAQIRNLGPMDLLV